jgi:large subunit ribosomal protein L3
MDGILGKKIGMTQVLREDGVVVPVTILRAGPCLVVQKKTGEIDGYEAIQIGLLEQRPPRRVTQPMAGHLKRAGVAGIKKLAEVRAGGEEGVKEGDEVKVTMFQANEYVDVVGTSKGKGYQGVVRRHGFAGGRATHGSMFHRAPGSIGGSSYPSRVFPGMRAGGRMGGKRSTMKNLRVVRVDGEENLLFVQGAVPGGRNSYVLIRRAKRG